MLKIVLSYIFPRPRRKSHDTYLGIDPERRRKNTSIAHKHILHSMDFAKRIDHGGFWIHAHTAGSQRMKREEFQIFFL